jgi:hypothetical protein
MAKKKQAKKFNYAIGHYWEGDSGSVGVYTYFNDIHYGTMEEAQDFLAYVQSKRKTKAEKAKYKIFQLIEVPV